MKRSKIPDFPHGDRRNSFSVNLGMILTEVAANCHFGIPQHLHIPPPFLYTPTIYNADLILRYYFVNSLQDIIHNFYNFCLP